MAKKAPTAQKTGSSGARTSLEVKPSAPVAKVKPSGNAAAKPAAQANPVGRPTSYKPEYAELAHNYCLLGANNQKLAVLFDVAPSTFSLWLANIPEFSDAVKKGRDVADALVAKSLYQRALGYSHPEMDIKVISGLIVQTETVKHYPPDTTAATMWLKNRQPETWRDKVENVISGTLNIKTMSDAELLEIATGR